MSLSISLARLRSNSHPTSKEVCESMDTRKSKKKHREAGGMSLGSGTEGVKL